MKPLALVKIGLVLALGVVTLPGLCATSTIALARGDGGGNGGGGAAGGGGGGSEGGGGGSVLVPPADNSPPRNPPGRNPPGRGATVLRESDRALPSCIDYRREMYGFYGAAIPVRCQPYLRFYDED
ncbi:MAG TPA: hypothetical protein VG124_14765 [Beijerinckiaceae bacterium]|jgi:hypothetical protein|nr:hypothetical protein [Beijerinckiaceae bacterium]